MLPWQQPDRIFDMSSQSLHEEAHVDARAMAANVCEESHFHSIERDDGMAVRSTLEDLMNTMPDYMCADYGWPNYISAYGGNANADDEFSLSFLENLIEPVGQFQTLSSPCRPISPVYPSGETSGSAAYQHKIDAPYDNHLNGHLKPYTRSNSINSMHKSFSPSFVSGESSGICLANTDTSFIHPSPVYSEASTSFAVASQHDSFYMSNHGSEHLDTHMGMYENGTNSLHASILPRLSHGNVCMAYPSLSTASNIASSDGDFFDSEASSLLTFASASPHNVKLAIAEAVNPGMMVNWPQQTRAAPIHEEFSHCMNTAGASRNPEDCEAAKSEDPVTFLVESSTTNIEDGYMWRKYGQKIIKDRVHPRSYFKCAQPNCPVKKQTENSSDQQGFVLITYIGRHNH